MPRKNWAPRFDAQEPITNEDVIYIAGPMTGYENFNYDAFNLAAKLWERQGWIVLNPAGQFNGDQDLPYETYMRSAIGLVYEARALALLPKWEDSRGARMEVFIAQKMGYEFYDALTGGVIEVPALDATFV